MVGCAVFGCKSRSGKQCTEPIRFFSFPAINSKISEDLHDLVLRRRSLWITRIARKDLTMYDCSKIIHSRVCSKHFIKGSPSVLKDTENPDWAPSINLGHSYFENGHEKKESTQHEKLKKIEHSESSHSEDPDSDDDIEYEDEINPEDNETINEEGKDTEEDDSSHKSDRLTYFIFDSEKQPTNSKVKCGITHREALKAANTLLCYMESQEDVDDSELIFLRCYISKIRNKLESS